MTDSTLTANDRSAQTDLPLMGVLSSRWSPRAFDSGVPVDEDSLTRALEAARWSPSAANTQPWRFIVARRGSSAHDVVQSSLMGANQMWAGDAGVLIVALAETVTADGRTLTHAHYDLGQAIAHLSVQAHHDGLHIHQMSGFDAQAVQEVFAIPAQFEPLTVIAMGTLGDPTTLPAALQERERAPRSRRPLADTVIVTA